MQALALIASLLLAVFTTAAQGISSPAATLNVSNNLTTVDYSTAGKIFNGDPGIFAGNEIYVNPNSIGTTQVQTYGITMIRAFAAENDVVGSVTSSNAAYLTGYPACTGASPCNPSNWNWSSKNTNNYITLANTLGIKVLLDIIGTTVWNDSSGTGSGVPTNMTVYNDIATKIYQHWTPNFVELNNEPDISLNISGSSYGTTQAAYFAMYAGAAAAIKAVSSAPIGGPVITSCCSTASQWIPQFLTPGTSGIASNLINFISYHNYTTATNELYNGESIPAEVQASSQPTLPVWVTEWNADGTCSASTLNDGDANAGTVPFYGMRLVNMLNFGISKAFFWQLYPDVTNCSFYSGSTGAMDSKARVVQMMSLVLGMGAGAFTVQNTTNTGATASMGAINSTSQHVAVVVNNSGQTLTQIVTLNNTGFTSNKTWNTYIADIANSATSTPVESVSVTPSGGTVTHTITVPANAVAGVLVQ